jgi:hypothetical protein
MTPNNRVIQGIPASPGIVLGRAKVLAEHVESQPFYCLLYSQEEVEVELARFLKSVEQAEADLIALRESLSPEYQEHGHLLDVQILMLKERMIFQETQRFIQEERYNAEWALFQAWQKVRELFQGIGDPYIKGRIQDVEEVYRRSRQRNMDGEVDLYDGDLDYTLPFESEGVTFAETSILRTAPPLLTPPLERSNVLLAGIKEAGEAYGYGDMIGIDAIGFAIAIKAQGRHHGNDPLR